MKVKSILISRTMADAKEIKPSTAAAADMMCLGYELFVGLVWCFVVTVLVGCCFWLVHGYLVNFY